MDMLGMYPTFYVPGIGTAWARHIWPVRSAVISKMRCVPTVMGKLGKTPP